MDEHPRREGQQVMRPLVVYESMWGNTRAVARALAEGVGRDVSIVPGADSPAPIPDDVDLMAWEHRRMPSPCRASTRRDAIAEGAPIR